MFVLVELFEKNVFRFEKFKIYSGIYELTYKIYVTFELYLEVLTKTNNLRIEKGSVISEFELLTHSTNGAIHNFEFA